MPTFCKKTCNDVNDSISFSEFHNVLKEADVVLREVLLYNQKSQHLLRMIFLEMIVHYQMC